MKKKYRTDALAGAHETAEGLHRIGLVDAKTMRDFDVSCLTPVEELSPEEIVILRKKAGVSQAVFASYLNVTVSLISKWERGEKHPRGPSLKLLSLVQKKGLEAVG